MELMETIRERASYRDAFTEERIPREALREIVEAGYLAPSGCNRQTCGFIAVDDPELLHGLGQEVDRACSKTAAAAIFLLTPRGGKYTTSYETQDYAAAAQNILLAITAKGYAGLWIEGNIHVNGIADRMGALLGVPDDLRVAVYIPVGVPAKPLTRAAKEPFGARVRLNGFQNEMP